MQVISHANTKHMSNSQLTSGASSDECKVTAELPFSQVALIASCHIFFAHAYTINFLHTPVFYGQNFHAYKCLHSKNNCNTACEMY